MNQCVKKSHLLNLHNLSHLNLSNLTMAQSVSMAQFLSLAQINQWLKHSQGSNLKNGSIYLNSSNFSHWLTQWLTQGSYI